LQAKTKFEPSLAVYGDPSATGHVGDGELLEVEEVLSFGQSESIGCGIITDVVVVVVVLVLWEEQSQ